MSVDKPRTFENTVCIKQRGSRHVQFDEFSTEKRFLLFNVTKVPRRALYILIFLYLHLLFTDVCVLSTDTVVVDVFGIARLRRSHTLIFLNGLTL